MKTILITLFSLGLAANVFSQDTSDLDSAAIAKEKLKKYESLLMNKWWIPVTEKSDANECAPSMTLFLHDNEQ